MAKEWGELAIKITACTAREYFNVSQSNGLKMLCHSSKPPGYFSRSKGAELQIQIQIQIQILRVYGYMAIWVRHMDVQGCVCVCGTELSTHTSHFACACKSSLIRFRLI